MADHLYHFKNASLEIRVQRLGRGAYVIMGRSGQNWKTISQHSTRTAANQAAQKYVRGFWAARREIQSMIDDMTEAGILDRRA